MSIREVVLLLALFVFTVILLFFAAVFVSGPENYESSYYRDYYENRMAPDGSDLYDPYDPYGPWRTSLPDQK